MHMPIVAGISFGITIPHNRISKRTRNYNPYSHYAASRGNRVSSVLDFAERGTYKQNRTARVVNQYSLYNKKIDTPTRGTVIDFAF